MGEWRYSSITLYLGTRWSTQLHPWGKISLYSLHRRLGGPHSRSGRYGEEINLASAGNGTPGGQPIARRYTDGALLAPACSVMLIINLLLYSIVQSFIINPLIVVQTAPAPVILVGVLLYHPLCACVRVRCRRLVSVFHSVSARTPTTAR
jgi:hypothetical protein